MGMSKLLRFALIGAVGCLAGWLVGEAFLWAALPDKARDGSPSLAQKPEAPPALKDPESLRPKPPAALPVAKPLNPPKPSADFEEFFKRTGAKTGDVQLSLRWDNINDLDLHCVDPNGDEIFFGRKKVRSLGELDVDMNAEPPYDPKPGENIYWPQGKAPAGRYDVFVNLYRHRRKVPTDFRVRIVVENEEKNISGTLEREGERRLLHSIQLKPGIRLAAPPEMLINQDGSNVLPVRIARDRFDGPVTLVFTGDLEGLRANPATLKAGETSADLEIGAGRNAKEGSRTLRLLAQGGGASAEAEVKLVVKSLPRALRISTPALVSVNRGGTNQFKVLIARDYFEGPVTLRWDGDRQNLTVNEVVIPKDRNEADVTVEAGEGATEGTRELRLVGVGAGGEMTTESKIRVEVLPSSGPAGWSWVTVLVIGAWTALLAVGLSLALAMGQNRYLARPLLTGRQAVGVILGALMAGLVAGAIGQAIYGALVRAELMPELGFVVGWVLLGLLLGRGFFFIPNLDPNRAMVAGAVGGAGAAALGFLLLSPLGGNLVGRLVGSAILGAAIGLAVVLVEMAFRRVWLQIIRGPKEVITVNLGSDPVSIGSDGKACTVYSRGVAPVAVRYQIRNGQVMCEDVAGGRTETIAPGDRRRIGSLEVVVCGAGAEPVVVSRSAPLTQPVPATTSPPSASRNPDACPTCGRAAPGSPGRRYCMICDRTF